MTCYRKKRKRLTRRHADSVNAETNNAIDTIIREMLKAKTPSDELEQWLKESLGRLNRRTVLGLRRDGHLSARTKMHHTLGHVVDSIRHLLRKLIDHSSTKAGVVGSHSERLGRLAKRENCRRSNYLREVVRHRLCRRMGGHEIRGKPSLVFRHVRLRPRTRHRGRRARVRAHPAHPSPRPRRRARAEAAGQAAERFLADGLMQKRRARKRPKPRLNSPPA